MLKNGYFLSKTVYLSTFQGTIFFCILLLFYLYCNNLLPKTLIF